MRLVLIKWLDSFGCSATWQDLETSQPKPLICQSVGWLLHDGDDCKVIVPHITDQNSGVPRQGCGDMTIPAQVILDIIDLPLPGDQATA